MSRPADEVCHPQTARQTDSQADRDRQTDRQTETDRQTADKQTADRQTHQLHV
jgi:hypothetical protein